ncbi:MAG: M24 family metallopeptidase [Candidatus Binatia bacterium]
MAETRTEEALLFEQARGRIHMESNLGRIAGSPWYHDSVYEKFSDAEYQRRFKATQDRMASMKLDVLIAPGGPNHWSFGGGMRWLSNHWEWHGVSAYAVVPPQGEPVLVCGPSGAHREAVRRLTSLKTVLESRHGNYSAVIVDLVKQWGLANGRIGISETDPAYHSYLPVNEYQTLQKGLPEAELVFAGDFFHSLVHVKSDEEIACVEKAGELMDQAIYAMAARAKPGVTEYQLAAAAAYAILDGGGQIDFQIIGSTSMDNPSIIFGNPWPSGRVLKKGDIIINELACGYRGYTVQIGTPICIGEPPQWIKDFFYDIVLEGFNRMAEQIKSGKTWEDVRRAGQFYKGQGYDSRPLLLHCIDFVSHRPHVRVNDVVCDPEEMTLVPNIVAMLEPGGIMPDGRFGIFFGRTFVTTKDGNKRVTRYPSELTIV